MTENGFPRTYINRRRAAMADEQLVPEIQRLAEDMFLGWIGPEFPNVILFPDQSVLGSSLMLTVIIGLTGNLRPKPGDPAHFDPAHTADAYRDIASRLRATRLVFLCECWHAPADSANTPPRLHPDRTDALMAMVIHKGETEYLGIKWDISTNGVTRTLGVPQVDRGYVLTNPDLIF